MGVTFVELINIGVVTLAREQQVAMCQHRALGPARRARGIEEPSGIGRCTRLRVQWLAGR